jgi:hypothetical protein
MAGRDLSFAAPITVLSASVWGLSGWYISGYFLSTVVVFQPGVASLETSTAMRALAGLVCAFIAYMDKASLVGQNR